jgi:hypothetical protein
MRKKFLNLILVLALSPLASFSAEKTWTGKISDSMCGVNHKAMAKEHQKEGAVPGESSQSQKDQDRECTLACVRQGAKYVFVTEGKVYEIENQDYAKLEQHAGHTVKLTGEMDPSSGTIKVTSISM